MEREQVRSDSTGRWAALSVPRPLRIGVALVAATVVVVFSAAGAQAAPGDLDPTFSGDGRQTTGFAIGSSYAAAVALQRNGKMVVVGSDEAHRSSDFALARYNPDGSLDTSFSDDGKQRTDFPDFGGAGGVAIQDDGKIVAVGTGGHAGNFALARYNHDGSLDTSFSGDGKQTTDFAGRSDGASAVAIQGDGKIVVVGSTGHNRDFALARYKPNGSLDKSFSGDGKQTTFGFEEAGGVALQTDGKIVVVGHGFGPGTDGTIDFAVARYKPNGSLDPTFSGDGRQTTDFDALDGANGVAVQGNGKIVAVGRGNGGDDFVLARYRPNGSLDPNFSGDGRQTTDFDPDRFSYDGANAVTLQGDGKIVAAGFGDADGRGSDFALARYNLNGSLDPTFSGDGMKTTDFGTYSDGAADVALQSDGRIVAVGCGCGGGSDFALARYRPNGRLDPSFSGDGKRRTNFGGVDAASAVALQDDGKIVAVGDGFDEFALARYNPNGSPDTSFSGNGRQLTSFGGCCVGASGVALQDDGKIVAVGSTGDIGDPSDFALARYNPNGSLDKSFSGDGKQTTDFGSNVGDRASAVAVQDDGKIIVVGTTSTIADRGDFALARYNLNGSLDASFSGDGRQTTDLGGAYFDEANAVVLQDDGKIVVAGTIDDFGPNDFALARYTPNGTLDPSFSGNGQQRTDFGDAEEANGVALQPDGKIVAVGFAGGGATANDFALARYDPDGSPDASFSGDGMQTTDFGLGAEDRANGLAVQGDGKIVAVGVAGGGPTATDFALARYDSNGSLDPSFSGDGRRRTDFRGGDRDAANAVALQSDGNIVAAGIGRAPNQTDSFALARYLGG